MLNILKDDHCEVIIQEIPADPSAPQPSEQPNISRPYPGKPPVDPKAEEEQSERAKWVWY